MWIHRTTPDTSLTENQPPFRLLFGRDARTKLDAVHFEIDEGEFQGGTHIYEADKWQAFEGSAGGPTEETRGKIRTWESHSTGIGCSFVGNRVQIEDNVLVKEKENTIAEEGTHRKLANEHWTGPWEMTTIAISRLSYEVAISGRKIRKRGDSAGLITLCRLIPAELRHEIGDKCSHFIGRGKLI